jgi:superfamily I DNA/RNA helicase
LDLPIKKVDLLMVDECQDLNRAQQELAFRSANRLVFCGDEHQAIYAFAGADAESMGRLTTRLEDTPRGCSVLPLNQTRRCGKSIVKEANQIVPDFYAHPSNSEGEVKRIPMNQFTNTVKSEDMVLCRTNAPLVSYCFKLLKEGRKARIQGRDIGEGLISLIRKMRVDTIPEFEEAFEKWFDKEEAKLLAKKRVPESVLIALYDKKDCLLTFAENSDTVEDMIAYIQKVFSDVAGPGVLLSSIHRAKGLESGTVFLLNPHLIPHPMAKSEQAQEQEWNLKYVAITRAINTLVYVDAVCV